MQETPTICSSSYATSSATGDFPINQNVFGGAAAYGAGDQLARLLESQSQFNPPQKVMASTTTTRRIVQVFIADPDSNVPLDKSVLYTGEQKLTDLNDNELFFEIPIAETMKKHNDLRVTLLDKDATKKSGRDVHLEPAKIRDLKMLVVTIASF